MGYKHTNAARECSLFKNPATRLLLMTFASAVDNETSQCTHSAKCLRHWTKLAKSTFFVSVKELEEAGVLSRKRRFNQSNVWTLNIVMLEGLRDPYKGAHEEEPTTPEEIDQRAEEDELLDRMDNLDVDRHFDKPKTAFELEDIDVEKVGGTTLVPVAAPSHRKVVGEQKSSAELVKVFKTLSAPVDERTTEEIMATHTWKKDTTNSNNPQCGKCRLLRSFLEPRRRACIKNHSTELMEEIFGKGK